MFCIIHVILEKLTAMVEQNLNEGRREAGRQQLCGTKPQPIRWFIAYFVTMCRSHCINDVN